MNYAEIITKQRAFFNSNQTKQIDFRIQQLKKLKSLIKRSESDLCQAIYNDFKKSEFDTYSTELGIIYKDIDEAIDKVREWSKPKHITTNLINLPGRSYSMPEPLGVCLVMGAWNYPYQLSFSPLVAAMCAGNTVILKPSEIPPGTSREMAKLINENFPPEYLKVMEGGIAETTALLEEQFDKIFFTGSTPIGKVVYQAAAKHLTPVTLELGGKSPAIVTASTNLKVAAKRIVWGKFLNAGQTCIAPDYILVEEQVKVELLNHLKSFIQKFDYSFDNHNYVQIINDKNFNRLVKLIDKEKIFFGGETDAANRYIAPTLLNDITFEHVIMEQEIFGPILPVISYTDLEVAIAKIKSKPKPLSCYIFTNEKSVKEKILKEISFGGGAVNDTIMHISNNHLPFGGVGDSGIGNYHSEAGFATFSHYKSVLEKSFWLEPNLKYPPNTDKKLSWIKRILGN